MSQSPLRSSRIPCLPPGRSHQLRGIDSPSIQSAGPDLLSLALIDARNRTLRLLARFEELLGPSMHSTEPWRDVRSLPLWLAGHIGWFGEWWIARNVQRALGVACPARPTRLGPLDPRADGWWDPAQNLLRERASREPPDLPTTGDTRAYLLESMETSLELLAHAAHTDSGLYFWRLALFYEDLCAEQFVVIAQRLGLRLGGNAGAEESSSVEAIDIELSDAGVQREPLWLPAIRWELGRNDSSFCFAQEQGVMALDVPEFEIDAQPVSWHQFAEFALDDGYEREDLWQPEGWQWRLKTLGADLQTKHCKPRYIQKILGGSVVQLRFGREVRVAGNQAAVHLSWWEADAWARWAGRRIATEVEWEIAAHTAGARGFGWGEVHEWTAGTLRAWPGFRTDPWSAGTPFDPEPAFGRARVLRGASFATPLRLADARRRGFAWPGERDGFYGFRTCAIW